MRCRVHCTDKCRLFVSVSENETWEEFTVRFRPPNEAEETFDCSILDERCTCSNSKSKLLCDFRAPSQAVLTLPTDFDNKTGTFTLQFKGGNGPSPCMITLSKNVPCDCGLGVFAPLFGPTLPFAVIVTLVTVLVLFKQGFFSYIEGTKCWKAVRCGYLQLTKNLHQENRIRITDTKSATDGRKNTNSDVHPDQPRGEEQNLLAEDPSNEQKGSLCSFFPRVSTDIAVARSDGPFNKDKKQEKLSQEHFCNEECRLVRQLSSASETGCSPGPEGDPPEDALLSKS